MKTYSSEQAKAKESRKTKWIYASVAMFSALIIALTVVLAVVFTRPAPDVPVDVTPVDPPADAEQQQPVDPPADIAGSTVTAFALPVENAQVTREASLDMIVYMPSLNMWRSHNGVDFAASEGTAVRSVAAGVVKSVEPTTLEGVVVTVEHENGVTSVYKSLASASVKAGDSVERGGEIGTAGTMMVELSDGCHLHLEMLVNGELVDPLSLLEAVSDK